MNISSLEGENIKMMKICIFTGTRAEYGLLKPLMDKIKSNNKFELQIIASGMHLSPEFGLTFKQIEQDGFKIDKKVEILLSSDSKTGISKSMGLALISLSEAINELNPDLLVVLGDRFETFAAAITASISRIPIAHLHGGELTQGVIDDAFRHSITKTAHIHFTSTDEYKKRVIQLGENPKSVFNVGAIGIDNIKNLKLLNKEDLEREINFKFNTKNLLATFHPVTLENNTAEQQFLSLLNVIDKLENTNIIFTKANADTDGRIINKMIDDYVNKNSHKSIAFVSMGQLKYLSAVQIVDCVIGNSSSGLIEVPSLKTATINIGDRQKGRISGQSVINCSNDETEIEKAINIVYSKEFQEKLKYTINPYGEGNTAEKIINIIENYDFKNIIKKEFYDISYNITNLL